MADGGCGRGLAFPSRNRVLKSRLYTVRWRGIVREDVGL